MRTRTVMLYGGNLVMSSIRTILQERPEFQVQQIEELLPDIIERLSAAPPDAILFNLAKAQPDFAIPLLRNHPAIMLIGVDLESNKMLVLSGEQSRLLTADDLVRALQGDGL